MYTIYYELFRWLSYELKSHHSQFTNTLCDFGCYWCHLFLALILAEFFPFPSPSHLSLSLSLSFVTFAPLVCHPHLLPFYTHGIYLFLCFVYVLIWLSCYHLMPYIHCKCTQKSTHGVEQRRSRSTQKNNSTENDKHCKKRVANLEEKLSNKTYSKIIGLLVYFVRFVCWCPHATFFCPYSKCFFVVVAISVYF